MPRTPFLTAAYHDSMDTALLVLLLAAIGGNDEMKGFLRSLLALYRENRELIQALTGHGGPLPHEPPPPPPHEPPPPSGNPSYGPRDEKCRPHVGNGTLDILDELLKKI